MTETDRMSVRVEEEKDRAESAESSCPSLKSDKSKNHPSDLNEEPGPSDAK